MSKKIHNLTLTLTHRACRFNMVHSPLSSCMPKGNARMVGWHPFHSRFQQCSVATDLAFYLTLPYGEDVLPPGAEASNGPMRIPELTVRLQNPQVQYSPGSILGRGTIPLPSEGLLTWIYPLTCTLSISKRTSAWKHISTSIMVTMTSETPNQENPGDPSPNRS